LIKEQSRWVVAEPGEAQDRQAEALASALSLSPLAARLLVRRGITDPKAAEVFLYGGPERLYDPFLMKGMREAAERIRAAAERGERMRVYGDYDADGVSSTAFMIGLLGELNCRFDTYIPHRVREGYGLNPAAIDLAAEAGVTLIVTVDTGISAVDQIAYARERGIDVVVTDHHEPPAVLPEAYAIVNPKQPGCPYPFKELAGAGVAFKLGQALLGRPPLEWADRAALGTIADLMPLTDENRIIVRCGLAVMRKSASPGLRALAAVSGIDLAAVTASGIAFGMAPRINASGRLDHADRAVRLLVTGDEEEAGVCAAELDALNRERQDIVDGIFKQAEAMWRARCEEARSKGEPEPGVIVAAAESWNPGVVGIVASKLIERTAYKPAIVLGIDPETGKAKGSARSIDGFDLHAAMTACADLFDHFGGHAAAAGMTLPRGNLAELERRLSAIAYERLTPEDWVRKTPIDLACRVSEADLSAVEQLALLEPYGAGNPQPRLLLEGLSLKELRKIGKDGRHLRLASSEGGRTLEAVGFNLGHLADRIAECSSVDLVGELIVNEWNGARKPQLLVRELRVPHVQLFDRRSERDARALLQRLSDSRGSAAAPLVVFGAPAAWGETAASAADSVSSGTGAEQAVVWLDWPAAGAGESWTSLMPETVCERCAELVLLERPPSAAGFAALLGRLQGLEAVHAAYPRESARAGAFPTREHFGAVYQTLRRLPPEGVPLHGLPARLAHTGWPPPVIEMMLEVFAELKFVELTGAELRVAASPAKRELAESERYRQAAAEAEERRIWHADAAELSAWIRRHARDGRAPL